MKKIFFALIALISCMSTNAQIMKVMKGDQVIATYKASEADRFVYEDVPIKGFAKATIGGKEVSVKWIQLWEDGPKFAEYNVGVTDGKAESYGGYYEWGGKVDNDPSTNYNTGTSPLSGNDDTATAVWGYNWRMPSKTELEKLVNNCTVDNITQNGVNGTRFTGKGEYSDNSIFLPKAGYNRGKILDDDFIGYYWSKTPNTDDAWYVRLYNTPRIYSDTRNKEYTVRAVLADPYNGHEYVDLGLSVKWATCNVGATKPEEHGGFYVWSATEEKTNEPYQTQNTSDWESLRYTKYVGSTTSPYKDSSATDADALKTVLDPEDDVAHVKWGGIWRMPTGDEMEELVNKCTWTWEAKNGINGYTVTGPNGKSIFLPTYNGQDGNYWSSSLGVSPGQPHPGWATMIWFGPSFVYNATDGRSYDYPVRP